jgi:hypothetical protein
MNVQLLLLVGFGKIPAPSSAAAFAFTAQAGIVLFGNGCPGTRLPAGQLGAMVAMLAGTTTCVALPFPRVAGSTTSPLAFGYMLAKGAVTLPQRRQAGRHQQNHGLEMPS